MRRLIPVGGRVVRIQAVGELPQQRLGGIGPRRDRIGETVEQAVNALRLTSPFNYTMDKRNIYISKIKRKK